MMDFFTHTAIKIFGLEPELWASTSMRERFFYTMSAICFLAFCLLAYISSCWFVYMVSGSWLMSLIVGLMMWLIIINVVRFSLVITRRSIFDELANDKGTDPNKTNTPQAPATTTPAVQLPNKPEQQQAVSKASVVLTSLKENWKKVFKIRKPASDDPIPGLAGFMQTLIILVMALMVIFPLACMVNNRSIEEINAQERTRYIQTFEQSGSNILETRTKLLKREIDRIEAELKTYGGVYQKDGLLREKQTELKRLKAEVKKEEMAFEEEHAQRLEEMRKDLGDSQFISLSFISVVSMPLFIPVLLVIASLLFISHLLLILLKNSAAFDYARKSTEHYRKTIKEEFDETTRKGYAYLEDKYKYKPDAFKENVYWTNPPYNTIKRTHFEPRQWVSREVFENNH